MRSMRKQPVLGDYLILLFTSGQLMSYTKQYSKLDHALNSFSFSKRVDRFSIHFLKAVIAEICSSLGLECDFLTLLPLVQKNP